MTAFGEPVARLADPPAPVPNVITVGVMNESVVYDRRADLLHVLDVPGTAVWRLLDGRRSVGEVCCELVRQFVEPAVDRAGLEQSVLAFLCTLRNRGLLATEDAPASPVAEPAENLAATTPPAGPPPALPRHHTDRFRALRLDFEVWSNDPAVCAFLDDALADLTHPADPSGRVPGRYLLLDRGSTGPGRYEVWHGNRHGDQLVARTPRLGSALWRLLNHVWGAAAAGAAVDQVVLHAGAVTRNGIGVVIVGPSGAGKTTLATALVEAGFGYLTDEAAVIDPDTLMVSPFPKPLGLSRGSWKLLRHLRPLLGDVMPGEWLVPASRLRSNALAAGPVAARMIVQPLYQQGTTLSLIPTGPAQTLAALADSTFEFRANPERNLRVLAQLVAGGSCYRLHTAGIDGVARLVDDAVRRSRPNWTSAPRTSL